MKIKDLAEITARLVRVGFGDDEVCMADLKPVTYAEYAGPMECLIISDPEAGKSEGL